MQTTLANSSVVCQKAQTLEEGLWFIRKGQILTIYIDQSILDNFSAYFFFFFIFLAPGSPPTGVVLDDQNPYRILVHWNPPNMPNGVITRYTIYVGYENGSVDAYHVNGNSVAYNVSNLYPFQIINVEISAGTVVGEGPRTPRMEVQTAQTCKW